jgi:hypothetical protein
MKNVPETKYPGDGSDDGGSPGGGRQHRLGSRRISVEYLASVDEGLGGSSAVEFVSGFEDEGFMNTSDFHGCSETAIDALLSNPKFILLNKGRKRKLRAALLDLSAGRTVGGEDEAAVVISIPVATIVEIQPALDPEAAAAPLTNAAKTGAAAVAVTPAGVGGAAPSAASSASFEASFSSVGLDISSDDSCAAATDPHHTEGDQCSEDGEVGQTGIIQIKPAMSDEAEL